MKSDKVYNQSKRQVSKAYNDALEAMLKKNNDYFKTVQKVNDGLIKPPQGLRTEAQIEAWKRGYLQIYMKQHETIDKMVDELQKAGVKTRKNVIDLMNKTYGIEERATISALDAKKLIAAKTDNEIKVLLDKSMTTFDKGALNSLQNAELAQKRLRREMALSIKKGESDKKAIQRIQRVTGMSEHNAMRVLETERTRVIGMAQQNAALEYEGATGRKTKKRWICTFHNSRESHIALHGEVVNQDEEFAPNLKFPGDPNAPAGETINCRCRMEIFDDGK